MYMLIHVWWGFVYKILWGFFGFYGIVLLLYDCFVFLIKYFTPQIALSLINSSSSRTKGKQSQCHEIQQDCRILHFLHSCMCHLIIIFIIMNV